jgi:hypothetical protein
MHADPIRRQGLEDTPDDRFDRRATAVTLLMGGTKVAPLGAAEERVGTHASSRAK